MSGIDRSREVQTYVLGYVVESGESIWLGEATGDKGHAKGKIVGPGGSVIPLADHADEMIRYCRTDFGLSVDKDSLSEVALKKYNLDQERFDYDVLVKVFLISGHRLFPHDTERIRDITCYKYKDIPYDKMFKDDRHLLHAILLDGRKLYLEFDSEGPDNNHLVTILALEDALRTQVSFV